MARRIGLDLICPKGSPNAPLAADQTMRGLFLLVQGVFLPFGRAETFPARSAASLLPQRRGPALHRKFVKIFMQFICSPSNNKIIIDGPRQRGHIGVRKSHQILVSRTWISIEVGNHAQMLIFGLICPCSLQCGADDTTYKMNTINLWNKTCY